MTRYPPTTTVPSEPPAPRRRPNVAGRIAGFLFVAVVAVIGGYVGYLLKTSPIVRAGFGVVFHQKTVADVFPGVSSMNLMVIGRDYDYTNGDQIVRTTRARSDMLMIGHLDFKTNTIRLLSIPRDTRVDVPGWGIGKVNGAHAHGGPELSEQTVLTNFGIPSDHYVAIDFEGFQQAIDQLGGVDLTVDRKMDYDDNWGHLHIHLLPGAQHLSGEQAMGFVRFRHADSDFVRVQRQQALIAALKGKLARPQTLEELGPLLNTIDRHIESDMTDEQKIVLARFIQSTPHSSITMETLPSYDGPGTFVSTDWEKGRPMIARIFDIPLDAVPGGSGALAHRRHHTRRRHSASMAGAGRPGIAAVT